MTGHQRPAASRADPRVLVADDHPLFRQALVVILSRVASGVSVEEHGTLGAMIEALEHDARADLIVLDLRLPDTNGFEGLVALRGRHPDVPVAVVSADEDLATVRHALDCGAVGFIPKSTGLKQLGEALATVLAGERWAPPQAEHYLGAPFPEAGQALSPAQARVWSCLQRGLMNKQIAFELGITEATVKSHLTGLFRRLGVHSRTQALLLARGRGDR